MENIWIKIEDIAKAKNRKPRSIRASKIFNERYIKRLVPGLGGQRYEVSYISLEPELQEYFKPQYFNELKDTESYNYPVVIPTKKAITLPDKAKRIALARVDLLNHWHTFRNEYHPKNKGDKLFLELYHSGADYMADILKVVGQTSLGSIKRWDCTYKTFGTWESLAPQYKYSEFGKRRTKLTDKMVDVFTKILLHQHQFNIGKATLMAIKQLQDMGISDIPSESTFRRFANDFYANRNDLWVGSREGKKALKDKCLPYIKRDLTNLKPGEAFVADGHKFNFLTLNPYTGKPERADWIVFFDWKSWAVVGYEISFSENTQAIASALRNAILNTQIIPDKVYQDNGRAFSSKYFSEKDYKQAGFAGIYQNLGITQVFAEPYNARAKIVERFFKEFQEEFEKLMPSYIGTSIEEKPAWLGRNEKLHKELHNKIIPSVEIVIRCLNIWLRDFHSRPCPNNRDLSISQMLDTARRQIIDPAELDGLMMTTELRTLHRNGVTFLKQQYYNKLLYGHKGKVLIKYSLFDLSKVHIYSPKGQFVCVAERVEEAKPFVHYDGNVKDIQTFQRLKKEQNQLCKITMNEVKNLFTRDEFKCINSRVAETFAQNTLKNPGKTENLTDFSAQKGIKQIKNKQIEQKTHIKSANTPVFADFYARYDYLMANGIKSAEDRAWVEKFKQTAEYKTFYGD